ncbi:MAG TPA: TIGR00725 family protein [bacterium]|nr:TIGR00725 family protein [bacterium]
MRTSGSQGKQVRIGVIGANECSQDVWKIAFDIGVHIARSRAILICGGMGGVMEAAAKGAKSAGGLTVGILPGGDPADANPYIDIPIATGINYARNVLVARTSQALIALGGRYGTLSEIAHALNLGRPVVGIKTWDLNAIDDEKQIVVETDPAAAVAKALSLVGELNGHMPYDRGGRMS